MNTRKQFIAMIMGFVGIGKAQQWKQCVLDSEIPACTEKNKPALNNQCPACGDMAEAYKRPTFSQTKATRPNPKTDPSDPSTWWVTIETEHVPYGETERITRCKRCNTAFWQDAA